MATTREKTVLHQPEPRRLSLALNDPSATNLPGIVSWCDSCIQAVDFASRASAVGVSADACS
eukprot:2709715-Pyramimonas_sp.AAC.1